MSANILLAENSTFYTRTCSMVTGRWKSWEKLPAFISGLKLPKKKRHGGLGTRMKCSNNSNNNNNTHNLLSKGTKVLACMCVLTYVFVCQSVPAGKLLLICNKVTQNLRVFRNISNSVKLLWHFYCTLQEYLPSSTLVFLWQNTNIHSQSYKQPVQQRSDFTLKLVTQTKKQKNTFGLHSPFGF